MVVHILQIHPIQDGLSHVLPNLFELINWTFFGLLIQVGEQGENSRVKGSFSQSFGEVCFARYIELVLFDRAYET